MSEILAYKHTEFSDTLEEINLYHYPLAMMVYNKEKILLKQLKKLHSGFLIIPGYDYDDKPMEIQLAITGKRKSNETFHQTFQREIAEEVGVNIDNKFTFTSIPDYKSNIKFSIITPKHFSHKDITQNNYKDTFDKIITWIHIPHFENTTIINRSRLLSDDIAGSSIIIVSVENMIKIFQKYINKEHTKYNKYCFTLK